VRLAGCPFTCFYCDTKESLPLDSGKEYDIEEACQLIDSNLKNQTYKVNFTGGDPLIQHEAVAKLAKHVQDKKIPTYLPPTLSHLVLILINLIMFYHFLI
jgi:organic radical activating enzyme